MPRWIWATSRENLFLPYANNKGADQPAWISAFVVCCLDSVIPILAKSKISKTLASLCSWAGRFESTLVTDPEDRFSHDGAHIEGCRKVRTLNSYITPCWNRHDTNRWEGQYAIHMKITEPKHDKTNKITRAPSKDSYQPGHPPTLISLHYALNG